MTVVECLTKVVEHCTTADECRRAVREFADTAQGVEEAGRRLMLRAAARNLRLSNRRLEARRAAAAAPRFSWRCVFGMVEAIQRCAAIACRDC